MRSMLPAWRTDYRVEREEFAYRDAPYPKLIFAGNLQAKQFHIPAHLTQTVYYNNSYNNNNSSYWGHNSSDQHQQQQQEQR